MLNVYVLYGTSLGMFERIIEGACLNPYVQNLFLYFDAHAHTTFAFLDQHVPKILAFFLLHVLVKVIINHY
jgi:hypothetical protein